MKEIPLPQKVQIVEKNDNRAEIVIEPLYPGYGLTLGNALRRVLISSLPGAAVTAIKIKGIQHEFSTIPNVKEDMVDIILNIKLVRLNLKQGESAVMNLKVKGEKIVTAKDIKTPPEIEIINPTQKIATLTDKSSELEIEFAVKSGFGYSPVESREKEKMEIGYIAVDSIFTPVLKVRFEIENVRVGQMTNFDRLTLEIETDNTTSPKEAYYQAAKILVDHFSFVSKERKEKTKKETEDKEIKDTDKEKIETAEEPSKIKEKTKTKKEDKK